AAIAEYRVYTLIGQNLNDDVRAIHGTAGERVFTSFLLSGHRSDLRTGLKGITHHTAHWSTQTSTSVPDCVRGPPTARCVRRRAFPRWRCGGPASIPRRELERSGIDAVAQAGRLRSVREHMPQVGVAAGAKRLDPAHAVAGVQRLVDAVLGQRLVKARPAATGFIFGVGTEQRRAAGHTAIDALGIVVVILAGERRLGAFFPHDAILLRRQLAPPFFLGLADLLHRPAP